MSQADPPHIVLMRAHDLRIDGRAMRLSRSLARCGYRVTLLTFDVQMPPGPGAMPDEGVFESGTTVHGDTPINPAVVWTPIVWRAGGDSWSARQAIELAAVQNAPGASQGWLSTKLLAATAPGRAATARRLVLAAGVAGTARAREHARALGESGPITRVKAHLTFRGARTAGWRVDMPHTQDVSDAMLPELARLAPDLIHVHDPFCIPTAFEYADSQLASGHIVRISYDAREDWAGLPADERPPDWLWHGMIDAEDEFVGRADVVFTVSKPIAVTLRRRFGLSKLPTVLLNMPATRYLPGVVDQMPDIRSTIGLPSDVPLAVYSGGLSPARGVGTIVRALALVPGLHLALVPVPHPHNLAVELFALGEELGVADRMHIVAPVPVHQVVPFLRTADLGVHPLRAGAANQDAALPNKLFEYLQAGVRLVVSDAKSMADLVRAQDIGEVFTTDDPVSAATALNTAILRRASSDPGPDLEMLRHRYSWESQEHVIGVTLRSILPLPRRVEVAP